MKYYLINHLGKYYFGSISDYMRLSTTCSPEACNLPEATTEQLEIYKSGFEMGKISEREKSK